MRRAAWCRRTLAAVAALAAVATAARAQRGEPAVVTRVPIDTAAAVNFRVLVTPDTVYVGQQTTYELGVFLDASVRDRLRRMEAVAPEMRGMMAYDPPAPRDGFAMRTVGHRRYEPHVYERAIFPLSAGRFVIHPARLVYALPLSYSFFSREETYELRSDSVVVVALDPPLATRPPDWSGAVGTLRIAARLDSAATRVGDPVVLTVSVAGRGNVKLFPRPRLVVPNATVVPADERVVMAPDSLDIHGTKEFDWVVTPTQAGRLVIPGIRYPFFDPENARYDVASAPAMTVAVAPGTLASADTGVHRVPPLTLRSAYRGPLAPEPYSHGAFWLVLLLAPLPAAAVRLATRPRRPRRAPTAAARLRALARPGGAAPAARQVRRLFLDAAAARLRVPAAAIAEPRALRHAARRAGTSDATAAGAAALLEELDAASFASGAPRATAGGADLAARADRAYRALEGESRALGVRRWTGPLALVIAGAVAAHAATANVDAARFARGVDAYHRGLFTIAVRDFAAVADHAPRAADAWANLGTAAWAASDTARAVVGWQRALRLEPLAGDVRSRLGLVGAGADVGLGAVPAIPPGPLALLGAALWVGAWLTLGWPRRRRHAPSPRRRRAAALAAGALALALVLGGIAAGVERRIADPDLVVIARDESLRVLPALAADRAATLRTGEIARVLERDGSWTRVRADGGREGWAETQRLEAIARD